MEKYYCPCWNVCLRVKKHLSKELPDDLPVENSFFSLQLIDVHLPVADVSWKYEGLVEKSAVQNWIIRRCANCDTYLYAERNARDTPTFLMNANLKKIGNEDEEVEKLINYSPVYKIVIDSRNERLPPSDLFQFDIESSTNKYIEENIELYREYLREEKNKMEERIRQYQQEEKDRFDSLLVKAQKDKHTLNRLVLSLSKDENEAPPPESSGDHLKPVEKKSPAITKKPKGPDDDFFDIELEEEGNESPDDFDDESDYKAEVFSSSKAKGDCHYTDGWDVKNRSGAIGGTRSTAAINISSLSENKRLERTRSCIEDDDETVPVDIARSMKELSLSLHKNYDSYVFGERPKSKRANASEIASSMVANRKDSEDF